MANDKSPGPTQESTPEPRQQPIREAWIHFAKSVQTLLVPQPHGRPLDQYLVSRDEVMRLVLSEPFLAELNNCWPPFTDSPKIEVGNALLLEMEAFGRSVEVAKATAKPEEGNGWWRTMLGRASTVSGSVKHIMDSLPAEMKAGLTLFKELVDLFRGKD